MREWSSLKASFHTDKWKVYIHMHIQNTNTFVSAKCSRHLVGTATERDINFCVGYSYSS